MITVLCSHLCSKNCRPLEPSEWTKLADMMLAQKLQPKDIDSFTSDDMKRYFGYGSEETERIKKLLDRAAALGFELEKLSHMGVNVITRADSEYPRALKAKLKGGCPPLFYTVGDLNLLNRKTLGFVGSRSIGDEDTAFTNITVGKVTARGFGVVSGGAKGVDSAAASASLMNGSFCIEYVSDTLTSRIKNRERITDIQEGRLLLLSAAVPDAGFSAGMAMARNKFIYAQSEATVVVKSDYNKGGTWSGATEALKKKYCPVLCRDRKQYKGNAALIERGAIPIDDNWNGDIDDTSVSAPEPDGEWEQLSFLDG